MLSFILLILFASSVMLFYQVLKYAAVKQKAISRLGKYINIDEQQKEEKKKTARKDFKTGLSILSKAIGSFKFMEGCKKKAQFKLNRAHILLKSEEYIAICVLLPLFFGIFGFLIKGSLFAGIIAGLIGWRIPGIILNFKIKKRIKYLNEQLNDAIVLISNSLKSGYSFFQSVDIVAKEMTGPISEEFSLLQKEINLGLPTEKALENLIDRVGSEDLELVVTAVLIQRQTGGNLSEVLDNISSTIRDRVRIKGEIRTITAQGRMSGLIISLLPPCLGAIIYLINPGHMQLLFKTTLGLFIIAFSVIMETIGIYFINKIVKIEV